MPLKPFGMPVKTQVSSWPATSPAIGVTSTKKTARLNDAALIDGSRILSAYVTRKGERIWIITEAATKSGFGTATTVF